MEDVIVLDELKKDTEKIIEDVAAVKVSADKAANNDLFAFINDEQLSVGDNFSGNDHIWYKIDLQNCKSVGKHAFEYLTTLNFLNLPSVETLGDYCFQYCSELLDVNLPSAKILNEGCFYYCQKIESVNLPIATEVGSRVFYYGKSIKTVNMPNVIKLGDNAFQYCSSLEKVDLSKVTYIGGGCFSNCNILRSVIIRTESVCTAGSISFYQSTPNIYVPDNLVSQYKSASNWSEYASLIKPLSEYVEG